MTERRRIRTLIALVLRRGLAVLLAAVLLSPAGLDQLLGLFAANPISVTTTDDDDLDAKEWSLARPVVGKSKTRQFAIRLSAAIPSRHEACAPVGSRGRPERLFVDHFRNGLGTAPLC